MGLARRIIPTLLARGDQLVKGEKFNSWRSVGHVEQAAKIYAARAADEIILLDIDATKNGRGPNFALVEKIARHYFTPLTVGGGVRSTQNVRDLLSAGADKVAICTFAQERPVFISECAAKFGGQAIVASVDVRTPGWPCTRSGEMEWHLCGALTLAAGFARDGAGEILLTSIDREGTMSGYDIDLIRAVSAAVNVPVIAHGGCSGYEDMHLALEAGASAVAAGALFQFEDATPREAALYLKAKGHEVRIP